MGNAEKIADIPSSTVTLRSREIEAKIKPLMFAILWQSQAEGTLEQPRGAPWRVATDPLNQKIVDPWGQLFRLVQQPVLNVLRYVAGVVNPEDQDDLLQEVMLRFYRYHRSYDFSRPLLPWLYAIARNVKRDWKAKSIIRFERAQLEPRTSDNVALKVIAEDLLAKLPDDDPYILWLSYNEGLSDAEISDHLSIPLTTTKYYLRRAKKRARDLLNRHTRQGEKNA